MLRVFKIALVVGSIGLACTQSVGALHLGYDVPTVESAVSFALMEKFNQQANNLKLTMVIQRDPGKDGPLPFPGPRPAPATPRT